MKVNAAWIHIIFHGTQVVSIVLKSGDWLGQLYFHSLKPVDSFLDCVFAIIILFTLLSSSSSKEQIFIENVSVKFFHSLSLKNMKVASI